MRRVLPLLVYVLAGCGSDGGVSGIKPDTLFTPVSGTPVTTGADYRHLRWAENGEEIAFVRGLNTAVVWNMNNGSQRTLFTTAGFNQVNAFETSHEAAEYFTVEQLSPGSEMILRRHSPEGTEILTRNAVHSGALDTWGQRPVATSRLGDFAYVSSNDSLYVRGRESASPVLVGTGCAALATFSPDATEIICFGPRELSGASRAVKFSLAGGPPLTLNANDDNRFQQAVWTNGGLYLVGLRSVGGSQSVVLYRPGQTSPLTVTPPFNSSEMFALFRGGILSADTRKFAYWTHYCPNGSVLFGCDPMQSIIYVKDLDTGSLKRVAVHNRSNQASEGNIAIAPDGSRLVYYFGQTIFQVQL